MGRETKLRNDITLEISKSNNNTKTVNNYLDTLDFQPYWYQGYACRGKEMIMKLGHSVAWFNDESYPYSTTLLPGNALRISQINPRKWPEVLDNLRNEMQKKYKQKFNTLLIERVDPNGTKRDFYSSAFSQSKESWIETNTKVVLTPIGDFAPSKVEWMTKVPTEIKVTDKKTRTEKTVVKHKLTVENEVRFKNRTTSFLVDNVREWKYRIPYKRHEATGPFYILTFRCIDSNKALTYLRNHFSLGSVLSKDVIDNCIVYKNILPLDQKRMYMKLAKNHLYIKPDSSNIPINNSKEINPKNIDSKEENDSKKRKAIVTHPKEEIISSFKKQKNIIEDSHIAEKPVTHKPSAMPSFIGNTIKRAPFIGSRIILNSNPTPSNSNAHEEEEDEEEGVEEEGVEEEIDLDELKTLLDMDSSGSADLLSEDDEDDLLLFNFINQ
jgi:hypothetical protein